MQARPLGFDCCLPQHQWLERLLDALHCCGIPLRVHPGKAPFGSGSKADCLVRRPIFANSLSLPQRRMIHKLCCEYDPEGVFNRGKVTIEDMYNLHCVGWAARQRASRGRSRFVGRNRGSEHRAAPCAALGCVGVPLE